jgi:hypothetical protein
MKIVVFGPRKRTGALIEGRVIDLSHAYAKYLRERTSEPSPLEMADVVVPSDLARLIEGGPPRWRPRIRRSITSGVRRRTNLGTPVEDYPLANRFDEIDTLVVLDDVLIPSNDRAFMFPTQTGQSTSPTSV